ncbi:MAG: bifunctional phosphopantothenoylcysteine decarboxylase/phosphopantothenate--cysteine ligase CoaBC [Gammaproteobacteria bacterium]|nr:bifunctional phosphopantothenoylcysteine decarboxylase/phosphopantothenate--cysteine ligase CoaBC [Gammaproteobacteria bacterium]
MLGICGSVAAYKSAYLVRELRKRGAEVRVITTPSARAFVTDLTLQALSGYPVESEQFGEAEGDGMKHINLARWADFIIVAPATANFIAKLAHGIADDLLSTVCIAYDGKLILAPAMNKQMWLHSAVQANVRKIRDFGIVVCGPDSGEQACGDDGEGRMVEPSELVDSLLRLSDSSKNLRRYKVVITAGPTHEPIDAVRYLTNRSSGRMGFALAQAAADAGADVHLVAGPVSLETPTRVKRYDVSTADEMLQAVLPLVADADIFIACAAVSDYRSQQPHNHKLKRSKQEMLLKLVQTSDILEAVGRIQPRPFLVGFAAETQAVESNAKKKLLAKALDVIVANQVGTNHPYGFDSLDNKVTVYKRNDKVELGPDSKTNLGRLIIEHIIDYYEHSRNYEATHTA